MTKEEKRLLGIRNRNTNLRLAKMDEYYENPKRCLTCGEVIQMTPGRKLATLKRINCCSHSCSQIWRRKQEGTTIGKKQKGTSYHAQVRYHARKVYETLGRSGNCENCGYSKYIEICHIKPVSEFPKTETLEQINRAQNLVGLCPNCHWELDHQLLVLANAGDGV